MGTSGTAGAARPVVDAVAGGVVVANEGRRGRRAKLMDDERPRTPADEDDGSAEGGRWQVGRRERRGCGVSGVGCRLRKIMVCARVCAGKSARCAKKRNGQKRDRANRSSKRDRANEIEQTRSSNEIEQTRSSQAKRTKKQSVSRSVIWYAMRRGLSEYAITETFWCGSATR